ncbi:MAG: MBL fold metallo-hydrolase [Candidatus Kapabacteria bacterium]|nr:MBL fold metallo-hydrolase [Candidatus Kapabacteria bacterium]MDW8225382.1 MBL fold metallo-hydrolase [Bacteroidota bacterium]
MWEFWTPTEVLVHAPDLVAVEAGPAATVGYLLMDISAGEACVIDVPMGSAERFVRLAQEHGVRICRILLTHTHWDHVADAAALQRITTAPLAVHPCDAYRLTDPVELRLWQLPLPFEPVEAQEFLDHQQHLQCGTAWDLEVRHTPGHTEGGVCFVEHRRRIVFSGDALFAGSIGRTDLPGGDLSQLLRAISEQLLTLPDDFRVFPGHGSPTTIGRERRENPFLQDRGV